MTKFTFTGFTIQSIYYNRYDFCCDEASACLMLENYDNVQFKDC